MVIASVSIYRSGHRVEASGKARSVIGELSGQSCGLPKLGTGSFRKVRSRPDFLSNLLASRQVIRFFQPAHFPTLSQPIIHQQQRRI